MYWGKSLRLSSIVMCYFLGGWSALAIVGSSLELAGLTSDERGPLFVLSMVMTYLVIPLGIWFLVSSIGFYYRATSVAEKLTLPGLRFSSGFSIAVWFIPIANSFLPAMAVHSVAKSFAVSQSSKRSFWPVVLATVLVTNPLALILIGGLLGRLFSDTNAGTGFGIGLIGLPLLIVAFYFQNRGCVELERDISRTQIATVKPQVEG
jgi:hypothetical protein